MQGVVWQRIRQKFLTLPKRWRIAAFTGLAFIALVLITPAIEVIYAGMVNPSTTGPIVLNHLKSKAYGITKPEPQMTWRGLDNVSRDFLKTVWVAEDGKFFRHGGFDWEQIRRSQIEAMRTGRPARGASTITQQCARSLFLWQGRSWTRKILEAYYTVWMELLLSKKRILELYVNVIELGDGIYGIEAASQYYFKESANDLTEDESATLVAIMPRPRVWNPLQPDNYLKKRKSMVMERASRVTLPQQALK